MTSNYFKRFLALSLSFLMIFVFSSCKKKPDDTSSKPVVSQTGSSENQDTSSEILDVSSQLQNGTTQKVEEMPKTEFVFKGIDGSKMFDGNKSTYWLPDTDETAVFEFSCAKPKKFNALKLIEYDASLSEFVLEIKINGEYTDICRLDEMSVRTAILDKEYTASEFRLSVTFSNTFGGIAEIEFITADRIEGTSNFMNSGYFCVSSLESLRENAYDKLAGYTDIILFDYGCWNEKGEFLWGRMADGVDEAHLAATLAELRALPQCKNLRIWFCLQNYDKKNINDVEILFKTEAAREKLSDFAVELCKKYGFYGIDIDYEYPNYNAWKNYDKFLSLCADKLHKAGYKFSCAFSPWGVYLSNETAEKIDYVNIMSYDYFGFNDNRAASYKLGNHVLNYFTGLGFKPKQLVYGIPFYVTAMEGDHPQGGGYNWAASRWRSSLKPWVNMVTNKKWTYYFNGANMVRDKTYYAMENNFAGVFNWSMRNDVPNDNIYGIPSLGQTVIDTIARFKK